MLTFALSMPEMFGQAARCSASLRKRGIEVLLGIVKADAEDLAAGLRREIVELEIVDALVGDDVHVGRHVLGDRLDEEDVALFGRHDLPAFGVAQRDRLELLVLVEDDHRRDAVGRENLDDIVFLVDAGDRSIPDRCAMLHNVTRALPKVRLSGA